MKHILCMTSGLTGILNASFELTFQLKSAGYKVTYACPAEVKSKVVLQGIDYIQLPAVQFFPAPELPSFSGPFRKIKRLGFKIAKASTRQQAALDNLGMTDFKETLAEISPDLLIIDVELHEHIMTAFSIKQPILLLSQWFSLWNRKGLPPLIDDTLPGNGWKGSKMGMQWRWQQIKMKRWWMFAKKKWLSAGTDRRSILKAYAKKVGFPLAYIKENYWPGPFTYDVLPVISMTAKKMEFPHDERPNVTYIGPMTYANRIEKIVNDNTAYTIDDALAYRKKKQASLIYCTLSTLLKGDIAFICKLIEAVKEREDWVLIITLGGLERNKLAEQLPENVFAFSYTPQLKVLAQADCSINHGGIHTINECIHFKVPMLVYSGKQSDQNGCAARVAYHNLGIMADKEKDSPEDIQNNISAILTDTVYRQNMKKMYQHYMSYKKKQHLSRKISDILSKVPKKQI